MTSDDMSAYKVWGKIKEEAAWPPGSCELGWKMVVMPSGQTSKHRGSGSPKLCASLAQKLYQSCQTLLWHVDGEVTP